MSETGKSTNSTTFILPFFIKKYKCYLCTVHISLEEGARISVFTSQWAIPYLCPSVVGTISSDYATSVYSWWRRNGYSGVLAVTDFLISEIFLSPRLSLMFLNPSPTASIPPPTPQKKHPPFQGGFTQSLKEYPSLER